MEQRTDGILDLTINNNGVVTRSVSPELRSGSGKRKQQTSQNEANLKT